MGKTTTLMDGLLNEMNRNRELLKEYESIGWEGRFGAHMIKIAIRNAEQAIRENDVVKILLAYNELKETK